MKKFAIDLEDGDLVDLEGDEYADPNRDHIEFECEYQVVCFHELETKDCVAIGFEGFDIVGFPPCHMLEVKEP
jgi:hypothetical protein